VGAGSCLGQGAVGLAGQGFAGQDMSHCLWRGGWGVNRAGGGSQPCIVAYSEPKLAVLLRNPFLTKTDSLC